MTDLAGLLILIVIVTLSSPALADDEPVTGAFGLSFGQVLDDSHLEQIATEKNGGVEYRYSPDHPYQPLSDYSVFVTPVSRRVYKIQAVGNFHSMKSCRRELSRLESVLDKKYEKTSHEISERFGDIPEIRFGKSGGKIRATCEGMFNSRKLVLVYTDTELQNEVAAEKEASQSPSKGQAGGSDTSGL